MKDSLDELEDKMEELEDSIETLKERHQGQDDRGTDRSTPDDRQQDDRDHRKRRGAATDTPDDPGTTDAGGRDQDPDTDDAADGPDETGVSSEPEASEIDYSFDPDDDQDGRVHDTTGPDTDAPDGNQAMKGDTTDHRPAGATGNGQDQQDRPQEDAGRTRPSPAGVGSGSDQTVGQGQRAGNNGGPATGSAPQTGTPEPGPQDGTGASGSRPSPDTGGQQPPAGEGGTDRTGQQDQSTDATGPARMGRSGGTTAGEGSGDAADVPAPEEIAPPEDQIDQSGGGSSEGDHPTQEERFREKVKHGLDSVEHGDREEAERLYRSLMLDFRSLKAQDRMSEQDQELLQQLYSKLHRAKTPVRDDD